MNGIGRRILARNPVTVGLTITLLVVAGWWVFERGRVSPLEEPATIPAASSPAPAPAEPATRVRLDPAPFRTQITRLEEVLFNLDARHEDGWGVEVRAEALADSLYGFDQRRTAESSRERMRAGLAVSNFATLVGRQMDAPYKRPDWNEWREQWEKLRKEYFEVAEWYATHDPSAPAYTVVSAPVAVADRATVSRLRDFSGDVQAAIQKGRARGLEIPDPTQTELASNPVPSRSTQAWRDWEAAWIAEVDLLSTRHREIPASTADSGILLARGELTAALDDLRRVTVDGSSAFAYPQKYHRRQYFDSAMVRVQRARTHLMNVGSK
jgi:hypothetical protein